jgi:exonuclease SbcD
MRFLHTSDWHLGRSLHRADLREAQGAFLDHLVETVRAEKVDAVLVSGDVYDRAIPPLDAVAAFEDALARLRGVGARVIVISGNHDSARRLGFSSSLIDAAGVHLRTRPEALADPVLLADDYGPVAVYGIPYLEPGLYSPGGTTPLSTPRLRGEDPPDTPLPGGTRHKPPGPLASAPTGPGTAPPPTRPSHEAVVGEAVRRSRSDSEKRGVSRVVVLAHAWVTGAAVSDSERDIRVGGVGDVPASVFDGFGYVALGHLHERQVIADNIRYSGSPLPYSFSEADHVKGTWLVELGDGKLAVEHVPAPVYRRLRVLRGALADLLASREHDDVEGDFLAVTLTDLARPEAAMDRLRRRFPHVLTLAFEPDGVVRSEESYGARVRGKDDLEVAAEFIRHVRNTEPTAGERALLAAAFAAVGGVEGTAFAPGEA